MRDRKAKPPVMRVKMTLSGAVQNMLLTQLHECFGIGESYPQKHEIICRPEHFARFMAAIAKLDQKPSIADLNIEWINVSFEPMRTEVRYHK